MNPNLKKKFIFASEQDMQQFAARLVPLIQAGMVIYLQGELGAGKTTLVRAILRALGWPYPVKSPSYSLLETYEVNALNLLHFDLYRLSSSQAFSEYGFDDYFLEENCCLIEWPERALEMLPPADIVFSLTILGEKRELSLVSGTERGKKLLFLNFL